MKMISVFKGGQGITPIGITQLKLYRFLAILLIILSVVPLAGCTGTKNTSMDINRSFTVGSVVWGMSKDEVKKILGSCWAFLEEPGSLQIEGAEVLGKTARVIYYFGKPESVTDSGKLSNIVVVFPENTNTSELEAQVAAVLGKPETKGTMLSGAVYDLKEENRYWHSVQSVYDALNDSGKSAALTELKESMKGIRDVDEAFFQWWYSTHFLMNARFTETERFVGKCLVLSGEGSLVAEELNHQSHTKPE